MKKAIIYDDTCPMCQWYTGEFVKANLLEADKRVAFSELEKRNWVGQIDQERSRDEIPLVDLEGGETLYGVDALLHLLGQRLPWLPKVANWRPLRWFFTRLYKLVSYNRRVIMPSAKQEVVYDCTPHFNWGYRLLYLILALGLGGYSLITASTSLAVAWWWPLLLLMALLGPALFWWEERAMEYAGSMSTVVLIGGLIVGPALWWESALPLSLIIAGGVMIWQAKKRLFLFLSTP